MSAFTDKKRPRSLRSGLSALRSGGWNFEVAFIYPFSTLKKKRKKKKRSQAACDKLLLVGREARRRPVHEREGGSRPVVRANEMSIKIPEIQIN